jgi:hypothetical protein
MSKLLKTILTPAGAKAVTNFVVKHPVISTTVGGGALAIESARQRAKALESEIMRNRSGLEGGHYVFAELNILENRKSYLEKRAAFKKISSKTLSQLIQDQLSKSIAGETTKMLAGTVKQTGKKIHEKVVRDPQRKQILEEAVNNDPIIQMFETENPGAAQRAYTSMKRFAPTLSTDPNVVLSYLREAAQTGGVLNYMTIKQLAETENAIRSAQGKRT